MTPDQINIAILLLQYAVWCTAFGVTFAGVRWVRRRR